MSSHRSGGPFGRSGTSAFAWRALTFTLVAYSAPQTNDLYINCQYILALREGHRRQHEPLVLRLDPGRVSDRLHTPGTD